MPVKELVFTDPTTQNRIELVRLIDCQATLERVALTDNDPGVRESAVKKVLSDTVLREIAVLDKDKWVRYFALERVAYDKEFLLKVAKHDSNNTVRMLAIKRFSNQNK